eukprot:5955614-Pleurochrysis_carterae.AAC.2
MGPTRLWRGRAPRRPRMRRVYVDPPTSGGGDTSSVSATPRVAQFAALPPHQAHLATCPRPPPGRLRRRLRLVEPRMLALRPRRYQRGQPLESVWGERPAKAHSPVHFHGRATLFVPPHEALGPDVRPLHRAEA